MYRDTKIDQMLFIMDDLVITNILRFVDEETLLTASSVNSKFKRCAQPLIDEILQQPKDLFSCGVDRLMISLQFWEKFGAQHNFQNLGGFQYGFMGACMGGNQDIAERMIKLGGPEIYLPEGLWNAAEVGQENIVKWLIIEKNVYPYEGLNGACSGEKLELVTWIITRMMNHHYSCTQYWVGSCLSIACSKEHHEICKLLINYGALSCSNCNWRKDLRISHQARSQP